MTAASDWDAEREVKAIVPSRQDSYERLCHESGIDRFLLDMQESAELASRLAQPRLERFIGVIYRPETELLSHYSECILPRQFDAYCWFDETRALMPLEGEAHGAGVPETYPFGE